VGSKRKSIRGPQMNADERRLIDSTKVRRD
jgi:hypothetical protein